MKRIFIVTVCLFVSHLLFSQRQNLDKLPAKERDSILVEIANEAIGRYSIGYLRPGDKPYIEDIGFKLNEKYKVRQLDEYIDRYYYAVYYLPTEMEKRAYGREYRVRALILADIGKVTEIRYCNDGGWCSDTMIFSQKHRGLISFYMPLLSWKGSQSIYMKHTYEQL